MKLFNHKMMKKTFTSCAWDSEKKVKIRNKIHGKQIKFQTKIYIRKKK